MEEPVEVTQCFAFLKIAKLAHIILDAVSPKIVQLVIPEHRSGFYSGERGIE